MSRLPAQESRFVPIVVGLISACMLGSFLLGGWWFYRRFSAIPARADSHVASNDNFTLPAPPGWKVNRIPPREFDAVLVLERSDPDATTLVAVRDNKTRLLTDSELVNDALGRLKKMFQGLSHDPPASAKLASQTAKRLVFQGERDGGLASGEVLTIQHQGFAYWLISWGPADRANEVAMALVPIRAGFALGNKRPNWTPTRTTFTGSASAYTLVDEGQRWTKSNVEPAQFDPLADMALEGMESGAATANRRATVLVVQGFADGEPPANVIRDRILTREKEVYPEATIEPVVLEVGRPESAPVTFNSYKLTSGPGRKRFVIVGITTQGDRKIALIGECEWSRRLVWEAEFVRLFGSYRTS